MADPKPGMSDGEGEEGLPVLIEPRLVWGLSHVIRQHILVWAVRKEMSPNELAKVLNVSLSLVSYHVAVLAKDCELLELVREEPRRGATEHFYRATPRTLIPAKVWRELDRGLRTTIGAGMANDLFRDLGSAVKAGGLDGESDYITRAPLMLDEEGLRRVADISRKAREDVEREHQAARTRLDEAGRVHSAIACTFAICAFRATWGPTWPDDQSQDSGISESQ